MYSDFYFSIGSSHKVCQDYALAGEVDGSFFAAVADGCSSSPHTDLGARFLCFGAEQCLRSSDNRFFFRGVLPMACRFLGAGPQVECLDSTILFVHTTPKLIYVFACGDGVIAARRRDGSVLVTELEFNNNAPAYLSYQINQLRMEAYTSGSLSSGAELGECGLRTERGYEANADLTEWEEIPEHRFTDKVTKHPDDFWWVKCFDRRTFDLVTVMSDGVLSFQRKQDGVLETVPLQAVLQQLLKFKTVKGEFVTRRCKRFLGKFCKKNGWSNYDDFSMGAVYVGE